MNPYITFGGMVLGFIVLIYALEAVSFVLSDTNRLAADEFSPSAIKAQYEAFQTQAATLDAKVASIQGWKNQLKGMKYTYGNDTNKWSRTTQESWNRNTLYMKGAIDSYNKLAIPYNVNMNIWYKKFKNFGDSPEGADFEFALPKEYKPYDYGEELAKL